MEVLLLIFTIVWDFVGELLLQLVFQLIGDGASHALAPYRRGVARTGPLSLLTHIIVGGGLGALSLLVWPHSMIRSGAMRSGNLIVAPLVAGLVTTAIGNRRRSGDRTVVALENFSFGFGFAFAFALVRFFATS